MLTLRKPILLNLSKGNLKSFYLTLLYSPHPQSFGGIITIIQFTVISSHTRIIQGEWLQNSPAINPKIERTPIPTYITIKERLVQSIKPPLLLLRPFVI